MPLWLHLSSFCAMLPGVNLEFEEFIPLIWTRLPLYWALTGAISSPRISPQLPLLASVNTPNFLPLALNKRTMAKHMIMLRKIKSPQISKSIIIKMWGAREKKFLLRCISSKMFSFPSCLVLWSLWWFILSFYNSSNFWALPVCQPPYHRGPLDINIMYNIFVTCIIVYM